MADIKEIIKDLGNTDWGSDNEAQMKAVQLLKGLATSDDPLSNTFMKKLSDASTSIAKSVLGNKTEEKPDDKNESYCVDYANNLLEGMGDMDAPAHINSVKVSDTVNRASSLL